MGGALCARDVRFANMDPPFCKCAKGWAHGLVGFPACVGLVVCLRLGDEALKMLAILFEVC